MKAVIVDDEADSLKILQLTIQKIAPEVNIVGTFTDPLEAVEQLKTLKPQVLFLDVQMPQL